MLSGLILADHRGTDNQEGADDACDAQRLLQENGRKKQRGNRIDIAEDRDGLNADPVHAPEIQQIGDPGMDDPHNQQQKNRRRVRPAGVRSASGQNKRSIGFP